jgi:hypothetical protein
MTLITADRIRDTTTTTGTGAVTVSGTAPTGFRTFSTVLATNDTFLGMIAHRTQNEWEVGLYTYSSTNTVTRTTILASSNAGSAVNFSAGTKDVALTQNAERAAFATDFTTPVVYGGAAAGSSLILQSTSGAGSSDFVSFRTGNFGIEGLRIDTNQDTIVKTNQNLTADFSSHNPTLTPNSGSFTSATCTVLYWRCGKFMYVWGQLDITTLGTASGNIAVSTPGGVTIAQQGIGTLWNRNTGGHGTAMVWFDTQAFYYLAPGDQAPMAAGNTWNWAGGFTVV